MRFVELLLLAVGLAMDAAAVSVCKGLALGKIRLRHALVVGLWFGGFQALMPLVGYFLGAQFQRYIAAVDHWIAFGLLLLIGLNMIRESRARPDGEAPDTSLPVKTMLPLAVATSVDALAVGITFAFLQVQIGPAVSIIGAVTFVISAAALKVGSVFGSRLRAKAEIAGGVILILLGVKILLEHLGVL